jgi:hypothetical protein
MWAVVLYEARGRYAYGPFTDKQVPLAMRFADFLTKEVDPAGIVPLAEVDGAQLRSPLEEVLNWREAMKPLFRWLEEARGHG